MALGDFFTAPVERLAAGGSGILHRDGRTVFMDLAAPGDVATGRIVEEKSGWERAQLIELVQASPDRVEAPCPLFGQCGGCGLQHMDYQAQAREKQGMLKDAFTRIARLESIPPIRFVPSSPYGYRNRMQFHRLNGKPSRIAPVGFKRRLGTEVLPVADCPIADPGIRSALRERRLVPPLAKDRFTVYSRGETFLSEGGVERGSIELLGRPVRLDASGFFQSNGQVLETLIADIVSLSGQADPDMPAADLYCGVGTFSIFLADRFSRLDLMEEHQSSLALARQNVHGPGVGYYAQKDTDWVKAMRKRTTPTPHGRPYSFAVVDPPRQGLAAGLRSWLAEQGPDILAYVSCDPATLARDSGELTGSAYDLESLAFYDFYPQTAHLECMAAFRRRA